MTAAARPKRKRPKKRAPPVPTLGPYVCAWIERNLVHGEGDYYAGVQAGQESAAEDAQEAIDAYRKASK